MIEGISLHSPTFINTAGHLSGLVLFGLLILLLLKGWNRNEGRQRTASLIAASLAFLWNLGSLAGLALGQGNGRLEDWLVAVNFSALSVLPAILFAVVLNHRYAWLARLGYLVSGCSVLLHFAEIYFPSARLHEIGLLLVTTGFAGLLIALPVVSYIKSDQRTSITDVVCLLLFTLSFLHFGYGHSKTAWTNEIAWHHAGIPLALIVLLRDYRLLLLETFIRFLANLSLAGIYVVLIYWVSETGHLIERTRGSSFLAALLLISFCCSLIVFAYGRSLLQKWLTRAVFQRGDLDVCSTQILLASSESKTEWELLESAGGRICSFVYAERFAIAKNREEALLPLTSKSPSWAEIELPLRFSRGDSLLLWLGPRRGGRLYLAEDMEALTHLSSLLVEQVERIRADELQRLAHEAELRALQAQVNPHFLFNALNTLYGIIDRESAEARRLVLNLAELFRYCLQQHRTLIPLGDELEIVQAYLEIESMRLRNRLTFEISAADSIRNAMIPVLSVQPLVENAIRHGVSRLSTNGHVQVIAWESQGTLQLKVQDDGPGMDVDAANAGLGIGLDNVRQRLLLCYGQVAELRIESTREGYSVTISIPLGGPTGGRSSASHARSQTNSSHLSAASTTFNEIPETKSLGADACPDC